MTIKHISFPSIEQFRSVIKHVRDNCKHHNVPNPTLNFHGSVKLHGTNHGVLLSPEGEIYTQSRERLTTPESDNAGSSAWTHANLDKFREVFAKIKREFPVDPEEDTIQIFGEWCGGNIQASVGLNNLPKMFVVFGIRISKDSDTQVFMRPDHVSEMCETQLLCIHDFPTFSIDIDFNKPEIAQAELIKLTEQVENDCPVARSFITDPVKELIGEGIVWETEFNNVQTLRFKVKGPKHSSSKVKVLAPIDVEWVASINEFVELVVTESRLQQGLEHVPDRSSVHTGTFIKWVMNDIIKEESDTMLACGFTTKDISGPTASAVRQWFLLGM